VVITGCSTKTENSVIKKINNDTVNEPSQLTLKEIHVIDSTNVSYPVSMRFDQAGDIYVLEYRSDMIKVFDGNNFQLRDSIYAPDKSIISSFSYHDGNVIINSSGKKRLYVINASEPENVLDTHILKDEIPNRIEIMPGGNFFGCFTSNLSGRDETFHGYDLKLVDSDFNTVKLLSSFFGSYNQRNIDPEIPIFPFTIDRKNNSVFAAVSSYKYYKIFTYDQKMNLKYIISNKAERVNFTESEKKRLKYTAIKFRLTPFKSEEKTIIESMTTDSEGNLWVRKAHDAEKYGSDTALTDVFDPEGKLLNTFLIPDIPRIGNFYISGSYLFTTSPFESRITIYEFDIQKIGRAK
jgi:sugar lactone lactonase YvrE